MTSISDHLPIMLFHGINNTHKTKPITFFSRSLTDLKMSKIKGDLHKINWNTLINQNNIDDSLKCFTQILTDIINKHALLKLRTIPRQKVIKKPWITKGILKSSTKLDQLYKKLNLEKTEEANNKYLQYKDIFNKLKRSSKYYHYTSLLNKYKNDSRKTWKTLNSIIGHTNDKTSISDFFQIDNERTKLMIPKKLRMDFATISVQWEKILQKPYLQPKITFNIS